MIKNQVYILLIISLLASLLVGCNGIPDYDQRLVDADQVVYNRPDSAKSILLAINPSELNDANNAYFNLLLTQASYINYDDITAENDSMINRALNYYKKHKGDKEKLTRSYIYKGAVLELLGKPDSAMTYYKSAELHAGENDHFNRGYAQLRMGSLYKAHNALDGRDLEKYEDAIESFRKIDNNRYLIISLKDLGTLYRFRNADKAEASLKEAISLAEREKDTTNLFHCIKSLAYLYFMQGANDEAYKQLQRIKSLDYYFDNNAYATFASVYANKGKVDSAMWFMEMAKQYNNDSSYYHSNNYLEPMSQIAKARGKMLDYYRLSHECDSSDYSTFRDQDIVRIMYSELDCDQQYKKEQDDARRNRYYIMAGIMLLLMSLALLFYRRAHRYDRLVLELKDQSRSQLSDLTGMQQNINEMQIKDERLKGFITSHMDMMREMIDACYHEPNNRIAENMKRIVKFQDSNRENWEKLYDYIDMEHNNIMSRTREQYPQLNDKDLMLLALTCMGYSYIQTAIIMGYSNATSVSVIKQRLAKKMGLDGNLNEYIEKYSNMKNE